MFKGSNDSRHSLQKKSKKGPFSDFCGEEAAVHRLNDALGGHNPTVVVWLQTISREGWKIRAT